MSRTPVRVALVKLEEEGLLEAIPSGGFAVRAFSERQAMEAVEIRGTLEGLAARFAAERRRPRRHRPGRALPRRHRRRAGRRAEWWTSRATWRSTQSSTSASPRWAAARSGPPVQRASSLPFASASALWSGEPTRRGDARSPSRRTHRCVLSAIERREGTRAEALMREHARIAHRNLRRKPSAINA